MYIRNILPLIGHGPLSHMFEEVAQEILQQNDPSTSVKWKVCGLILTQLYVWNCTLECLWLAMSGGDSLYAVWFAYTI